MRNVYALTTVIIAACILPVLAEDNKSAIPTEVEPTKIAVFHLTGPLLETPPGMGFGFDFEPRRSLHGLLEQFRKAEVDDRVKAIVLTFEDPMIGWAQMQELRSAIQRLRESDKHIYSYLESACPGVYMLATATSRICLVPAGGLDVMGLHVESPYLKGLLDKIGLEADIEQIGAYKGAGEPFTRTHPSPEAQEMLEWLARDLFDQMIDTIAEGRSLSPERVRALINQGPFNAQEARKVKLVDDVLDADAFLKMLYDKYGESIELVHDYGAKKGPEVDFSNPFAFFNLLGKAMAKEKRSSKASVALIYVDGLIMTGTMEPSLFGETKDAYSTTLRRVLANARDDDNVKAVVLRVDSPGGSALASDIIWQATTGLAEAKPLVVSMGNVAASGGYYVSADAVTIFADAGTITGSIGVIGGKLVTKGLWDWLGVSFHELSLGQNADLYNTNRRFDDRQRVLVRKHMQYVYDLFIDRVTRGRGDRLAKDINEVAGGRVYTGKQAQTLGLVDRIGGLENAIAHAAGRAKLGDYQIRVMPEPMNLLDAFLKGLTGAEDDEEGSGVDVYAHNRLGARWLLKVPVVRQLLTMLAKADPLRAMAVQRALQRLELLQSDGALLVMPDEMVIR